MVLICGKEMPCTVTSQRLNSVETCGPQRFKDIHLQRGSECTSNRLFSNELAIRRSSFLNTVMFPNLQMKRLKAGIASI